MKTDLYFAYGSNLDMAQMRFRCPTARPVARAVLQDYRLVFRQFCDVQAYDGRAVYGALYRCDARAWAALDRYEGYPFAYDRGPVMVTLEGGETAQAITYTMNSVGFRAPDDGYLRTVLQGYRDWGLECAPVYEAAQHADWAWLKGSRRTRLVRPDTPENRALDRKRRAAGKKPLKLIPQPAPRRPVPALPPQFAPWEQHDLGLVDMHAETVESESVVDSYASRRYWKMKRAQEERARRERGE